MDFVSDAPFDRPRLRALTVVDAFTRKALTMHADQRTEGEFVVATMARFSALRGAPKTIQVNHGPAYIFHALNRRAYENGVTPDYSPLGEPPYNAFVESFNGRLRDKCFDSQWLLSLANARVEIETWRREYTKRLCIAAAAFRAFDEEIAASPHTMSGSGST